MLEDKKTPNRLEIWAQEWSAHWNARSLFSKTAPAVFILIYLGVLQWIGGLQIDHLLFSLGFLILFYGGPSVQLLRSIALPFLLTGMIYDTQRFYVTALRGEIRVSEPYLFDLQYFGILTESGRLTPNQFFQLHLHPVLDFFCGAAYLSYFAIFILQTVCSALFPRNNARPRIASQMAWAFLLLNCIGYVTYFLYPAAPPWYVDLHGLGPARTETPPNPAGALRFDEMLGIQVFQKMYSKSANVFGAIPSLHVSYPLLAALFSLKTEQARIPSFLFYFWMCFSAVYLNHHYVLDVLWGSAYAVLVFLGFQLLSKRTEFPNARSHP